MEMHRYTTMLNKFECIKIDIYLSNLFKPVLGDEDSTIVEMDMSSKMSEDSLVGFFLTRLNYLIVVDNPYDTLVVEKSFVSIKDKFLNILQSIETGDIRADNVGLMLYISMRIYTTNIEGKRTYLTSQLRSSIFGYNLTWENYFIQRINKKMIDFGAKAPKTGMQKTFGILKTPLNLLGITKAEAPSTKVDVEKEAMGKKEFHPAIFMEIAQHLAMLSVSPEESTQILIDLSRKYDIGAPLMQSVFMVHQKGVANQFVDKVKASLAHKRSYDPISQQGKLNIMFARVAGFLPIQDALSVLCLSKGVYEGTYKSVYFAILRHNKVTEYQRSSIWRLLTFAKFPVSQNPEHRKVKH